jgi:acyl carrier protein phosphodiesterase
VDIFYDHFLAKEWSHFCKTPLDIFVKETEDRLDPYWDIFPEAVNNFLKRFFDRGWLNTYKTVEGIERVLLGMSKNTSLPAKTPHAIEIFNDKYANFRKDFYEFFPKIMKYVSTNYNITFCG